MAGSKTNAFETALLQHIYQNAAIANIGNAGGLLPSSVAGNFYIALYSVAPSETGGGTECNYTGYARVAVVRSASGFTVSGNQASNAAKVTFGECTGGAQTAVAFAIMTAASGGDMINWADLSASRSIDVGSIPEFAIGALTVTED